MKINVGFVHLDHSDSLVDYIEKHFLPLEKILKGIEGSEAAQLEVTATRTTNHHNKGDVFEVKMSLEIPSKVFRVNEVAQTIHAAVDLAHKTLKNDLQRYKELERESHR